MLAQLPAILLLCQRSIFLMEVFEMPCRHPIDDLAASKTISVQKNLPEITVVQFSRQPRAARARAGKSRQLGQRSASDRSRPSGPWTGGLQLGRVGRIIALDCDQGLGWRSGLIYLISHEIKARQFKLEGFLSDKPKGRDRDMVRKVLRA